MQASPSSIRVKEYAQSLSEKDFKSIKEGEAAMSISL
jgi:hypothetical protein